MVAESAVRARRPEGTFAEQDWSLPAAVRVLAAVVHEGSVSAAARATGRPVQDVVDGIRVLERHARVALLHDVRGVGRPTLAAEVYSRHCSWALRQLERVPASVPSASSPLRVGSVFGASVPGLSALIGAFSRRHPDLRIALTELPLGDLTLALAARRVDLVVVDALPQHPSVAVRAKRSSRLVAVASPQVAAAAAGRDHRTWVVGPPGTAPGDAVEAVARAGDLIRLGSQRSVVEALRAGLGVGLVHAEIVEADLADGRLVQVGCAGTPVLAPWLVCTHALGTPAAEAFVAVVRDPGAVGPYAFASPRPRVADLVLQPGSRS